MALPAYTEKELQELVFKDKYDSLEDYLVCFAYTCAVLHTSSAIE